MGNLNAIQGVSLAEVRRLIEDASGGGGGGGEYPITPYVVDPLGDEYTTVALALEAVVADGANTDSSSPALVQLSAGVHVIGPQLVLPENTRIAGATAVGAASKQSSARASTLQGSLKLDETGVNFFLSNLRMESIAGDFTGLLTTTGGNAIVAADGCTFAYTNAGNPSGSCIDSGLTGVAIWRMFDCKFSSANTAFVPTISATSGDQDVELYGSYVQAAAQSDVAVNCSGALIVERGYIIGRMGATGNASAIHSITSTQIFASTVGAAFATNLGVVELQHNLYLGDIPLISCTGAPLPVLAGYNGLSGATVPYFDNCTVTSSEVNARKRTEVAAAAYTVKYDDDVLGVTYTATGAVALTLPPANTVRAGEMRFVVKDEGYSASTGNITITPDGADTIDGAASSLMIVDGASLSIYSDGVASWFTY